MIVICMQMNIFFEYLKPDNRKKLEKQIYMFVGKKPMSLSNASNIEGSYVGR